MSALTQIADEEEKTALVLSLHQLYRQILRHNLDGRQLAGCRKIDDLHAMGK